MCTPRACELASKCRFAQQQQGQQGSRHRAVAIMYQWNSRVASPSHPGSLAFSIIVLLKKGRVAAVCGTSVNLHEPGKLARTLSLDNSGLSKHLLYRSQGNKSNYDFNFVLDRQQPGLMHEGCVWSLSTEKCMAEIARRRLSCRDRQKIFVLLVTKNFFFQRKILHTKIMQMVRVKFC